MILTFFLGFSLIFISEYLKRRKGDSNPRNALDVYTLSRRASSTTRAFLLSICDCKIIFFPVITGKIMVFLKFFKDLMCVLYIENSQGIGSCDTGDVLL